VALAESYCPGRGSALSQAWRAKQLEYTWLRTLSRQYRDFWQVTGDALDWAAEALTLSLSQSQRAELLGAYLSLQPFPENLGVLRTLHETGYELGTLSNGTLPMLEAALTSAGMRGLISHVLSVDAVGCYKTDSRAYALGTGALVRPASEVAFVSSNCWDAIGATLFGYRTFWVNRTSAPLDRLGIAPHGTGSTLDDVPAFVAAMA
jgi:2-haloacid dehalogenase